MYQLSDVDEGHVFLVAIFDSKTMTVNFDANDAYFKTIAGSAASVSGSMSAVKTGTTSANWNASLAKPTFTANGYFVQAWSSKSGAATLAGNYYDLTNTYSDVLTDGYPDSITLYAIWAPNTYQVTFHTEGGKLEAEPGAAFTKVTDNIYTYGAKDDKVLPNAKDENKVWTFVGWYEDASYKKALPTNSAGKYIIAAGRTDISDVYAKWIGGKVTIKFDANGGTGTMESIETTTNQEVKLTKNAFTKEGAEFAGWAEAKDGDTLYKDSAKAGFAKDVTLYAVWAEKGKTSFDITLYSKTELAASPEGYTAKGAAADGDYKGFFTYTSTYVYGTGAALPSKLEAKDAEHYTFKGILGTDGKKAGKIAKTEKFDLVYVADWKAATYKITYKPGTTANSKVTGKKFTQTITYGEFFAPAENTFEAQGYTFAGWADANGNVVYATEKDAQGNSNGNLCYYYQEVTGSLAANTELTAVWESDEVTVILNTFNDAAFINNGSATQLIGDKWAFVYKTGAQNKTVTLPTADEVSLNGAEFAGWFKPKYDAGGNIVGTKGKAVKTVKAGAEDLEFVAKWKGAYTITYVTDGQNDIVKNATIDKKVKLMTVPKTWKKANKDKYFLGWSPNAKAETPTFKAKEKVVMAQNAFENNTVSGGLNLTLYAVWADKEKSYTAYFYDAAGILQETKTFTYNKGLSAKALKKIGKKVADQTGDTYYGWTAEITGTDGEQTTKLLTKIAKKSSGDIHLKLASAKATKVKVSFNMNAPAGVKVKGKLKTRTVKLSAKNDYNGNVTTYVTGLNKIKANGYVLAGFAPVKYEVDQAAPTEIEVKENGKVIDISDVFGYGKSSVTLYAVWQSKGAVGMINNKTYYSYYYDLDDGTDLVGENIYAPGVNLVGIDATELNPSGNDMWFQAYVSGDLPRPSKMGYNFVGWLELQKDGKWKKATSADTGVGTRYFKATWTKIS